MQRLQVRAPTKATNGSDGTNSPPPPPPSTIAANGSFSGKKDSGYTSSRTSLEPSECGDEAVGEFAQHNVLIFLISITAMNGLTLTNVAEEDDYSVHMAEGNSPSSPEFPAPP